MAALDWVSAGVIDTADLADLCALLGNLSITMVCHAGKLWPGKKRP